MADKFQNRDLALLLDIMVAARDALSFVDGVSKAEFVSSRLRQNAVIRSLEIVGKAAGRVSPATREACRSRLERDHRHAQPTRCAVLDIHTIRR